MDISSDVIFRIGGDRCLAVQGTKQPVPMYRSAAEIVEWIKAALTELNVGRVESVRTLESGIVEEHAVVVRNRDEKQLLFRMWPIFYSHDKRVEYRIFTSRKQWRQMITHHLQLFAKTSNARLVEKT